MDFDNHEKSSSPASQLPLGLAMGMAMNENAMKNYVGLSDTRKEKVIADSRNVTSKAEMERLVERLGGRSVLNKQIYQICRKGS